MLEGIERLRKGYEQIRQEWNAKTNPNFHKKFTVKMMAKMSGVSYKHLQRAMIGQRAISEKTVDKALGFDLDAAIDNNDN